MSKHKLPLILLIFLTFVVDAYAQQSIKRSDQIKPRWVNNPPTATKRDLSFVVAKESSLNPDYSLSNALESLASRLPRAWKVSSQTTINDESVINRDKQGITDSHQTQTMQMTVYSEGLPVKLECELVDTYWELVSTNEQTYYDCYQLFQAAAPGATPRFDTWSITTSYSNDPVTWGLSLVPGAAQMHKGSYIKGGIIMGGCVALASGILVSENMRFEYMSKIALTHTADTKKAYNNKANNCGNARNLCIGGLAALYIYNIVDAFIAPGARRIIVTPAGNSNGQYGISASYNF